MMMIGPRVILGPRLACFVVHYSYVITDLINKVTDTFIEITMNSKIMINNNISKLILLTVV